MKIGAFTFSEPLPELRKPHAIAMLRPWVDVGSVGTLALTRMENYLGSTEIGKLEKPGNFIDFTRYRPTIYSSESERRLIIPNVYITCATGKADHDFLFLHLLEPHMFGEDFVDSINSIIEYFGVQRYVLLGSMYDYVPHTRLLPVTGRGTGTVVEVLRNLGVSASDYVGPTSITTLVSQRAAELGIENCSLIVHLPQYTQVEEDYNGLLRVLEILREFYQMPVTAADIEKAEQQKAQLSDLMQTNRQLKDVVSQLEVQYDANPEDDSTVLSPEVESFLKEMDKRFKDN